MAIQHDRIQLFKETVAKGTNRKVMKLQLHNDGYYWENFLPIYDYFIRPIPEDLDLYEDVIEITPEDCRSFYELLWKARTIAHENDLYWGVPKRPEQLEVLKQIGQLFHRVDGPPLEYATLTVWISSLDPIARFFSALVQRIDSLESSGVKYYILLSTD